MKQDADDLSHVRTSQLSCHSARTTLRTFKYRIYPSRKQIIRLDYQFLLCREMYNTLLRRCRKEYRTSGTSFNRKAELCRIIKGIKDEDSRFNAVFSQSLQNVADRLAKAYQHFFRRVKERKVGKRVKAGYPRAKKRVTSITYPQFGFRFKSEDRLQASKIGSIPIVLHRVPRGRIKTLTIKRNRAGQWFACFACEVNEAEGTPADGEVGIDVGIEHFATLSDGTVIENPRHLLKSEKRLKRLQRRMSRKKKGSRNRRKAVRRLARHHVHVADQRREFLHRTSRALVDRYGLVAVEKLNESNMLKNHCLAKHIQDASWDTFIGMLRYKAVAAGAELVEVDPRNTSQMCNQCGNIVLKALSVRVHRCPHCGFEAHRDVNVALNILARARVGQTRSHACGDLASTPVTEAGASGVIESGTIRGRPHARVATAGRPGL
ncbi:MAG: RNA-guided endonuclease TnpB family protein [Candidatus Undinarchaeales archaeon]|nr:RNA-guided endonuclease TnpB family protein [Candidatus Undinarchaeales archaeon]MDP7491392.1 RNA-guided endonuclease TnpB family protein [Candidatus Undinarchaeales archaeon]